MKNEIKQQFPEEYSYFSFIQGKIDNAILTTRKSILDSENEYIDFKKYNMTVVDPHEQFQNSLNLAKIESSVSIYEKQLFYLKKTEESPYFARIDFKRFRSIETYYIGRFGFRDKKDLLIIDWRSPLASMFYDYEIGPSKYESPKGLINGEIIKKRQFKITNKKLEYIIESSLNIQDEVLQKELAQSSDKKLQTIIATIQQEQNKIIRKDYQQSIIIQGVAGSGKTSIALHRIAFLLYRHRNYLTARSILIVSPNKVFAHFISSILPELGEENIKTISIIELILPYLNKKNQIVDKTVMITNEDKERVAFKTSYHFVLLINQFLKKLEDEILLSQNLDFQDITFSKEYIDERFHTYHKYSIKKRLKLISDDIFNRLKKELDHPNSKKQILDNLMSLLKFKTVNQIHQYFYEISNQSAYLKKSLEYEDLFPYLYLQLWFEDISINSELKHLVIDEMQDYSPIQYLVIQKLFSCSKTILGDFNQIVVENKTMNLEELKQLFPQAEVLHLTKSYRSTFEIMNLANHVLKTDMEPVLRHGKKPVIKKMKDEFEEIKFIKSELDSFTNGTLGILLKTNEEAILMYEQLRNDYKVHFINKDSYQFEEGILLMTIEMSKGLEFDHVIIFDVSKEHYFSLFDRQLLFVAITRAMHQVTITYKEQISLFLR